MHGPLQLFFLLATQGPEAGAKDAGLPFLDDLIRGGPYAIIAALGLVLKIIYSELKEERHARLADRDQHDKDKQALNDKVLTVSRETTVAVLQNTEVQRQLVSAISQVQEEA